MIMAKNLIFKTLNIQHFLASLFETGIDLIGSCHLFFSTSTVCVFTKNP